MSVVWRAAFFAGIAGGVVAIALGIITFLHRSHDGTTENVEWFMTMSTILGAPVNLLLDRVGELLEARSDALGVVRLALLFIGVPLNWALLGGLVGWLVSAIRHP